MSATRDFPQITLRIPGDWANPGKLLERLPAGCRIAGETLALPDGAGVEIFPMPPDEQFPKIFASSCRRPPTREELGILGRYTVNVVLSGPAGSREAAGTMMRAGAAIIQAGAAGVFIDNSALAHGGRDWIEMTEDGGPDAMSFAFAAIVEGPTEACTMGLQAMGLPNLVMGRADIDEHGGDSLIEIMRYLCRTDRTVDVGHVFGDEEKPRFQVVGREAIDFAGETFDAENPMHNPLGRLRIASMRRLAEEN